MLRRCDVWLEAATNIGFPFLLFTKIAAIKIQPTPLRAPQQREKRGGLWILFLYYIILCLWSVWSNVDLFLSFKPLIYFLLKVPGNNVELSQWSPVHFPWFYGMDMVEQVPFFINLSFGSHYFYVFLECYPFNLKTKSIRYVAILVFDYFIYLRLNFGIVEIVSYSVIHLGAAKILKHFWRFCRIVSHSKGCCIQLHCWGKKNNHLFFLWFVGYFFFPFLKIQKILEIIIRSNQPCKFIAIFYWLNKQVK